MHRHGYKGRKFGRETDQRRALIKGLAVSLIDKEGIETTLPKAKELVPYTEKLITKAKTGTLANRRAILSELSSVSAAHKLVDELAPKMKGRTSGHLRIEKLGVRRGDNSEMAKVSFVDDLKGAQVSAKATTDKPVAKVGTATKVATKPVTKKPAAKKEAE